MVSFKSIHPPLWCFGGWAFAQMAVGWSEGPPDCRIATVCTHGFAHFHICTSCYTVDENPWNLRSSEHPRRLLVSNFCNLTIRHSFRLSYSFLFLFELKSPVSLQRTRFAAKPRSFPHAMCCGNRCFIGVFVLALNAVQAARHGLQPSALTTQTRGRKCEDIKGSWQLLRSWERGVVEGGGGGKRCVIVIDRKSLWTEVLLALHIHPTAAGKLWKSKIP